MEKFHKTLIFAGVFLIGVVYASSANAATFQSLGFVNGASSAALEVSGDGSTVVGTTSSLSQAFVWTASQGMMPVSPLSGSTPHAILWGVNYDGSIAVGSTSTSCCGRLAATWTHADGLVTFDKSDPTFNTSRDNARAISDDGRTVVGYHQTVSSSFRPLVWVDGVLATPTDIPT